MKARVFCDVDDDSLLTRELQAMGYCSHCFHFYCSFLSIKFEISLAFCSIVDQASIGRVNHGSDS